MQSPSLFEAAELSEPSAQRGFWTDDEMFVATGTTSMLLVNTLNAHGLLAPSRYRSPRGQLKRAWKPEDLYVLSFATELSSLLGMSLAAVAAIMGVLPRKIVDEYLRPSLSLNQLKHELLSGVPPKRSLQIEDDAPGPKGVIERDQSVDLVLVDRRKLYLRLWGLKNADAQFLHFGLLENVQTKKPTAEAIHTAVDMQSLRSFMRDAHIVYLDGLGFAPFEQAYQVELQLNFRCERGL